MNRLVLFIAIITHSLLLRGQSFTDIQAGLTGVSESASNWIDYNQDGAIDIFVTGDFYNNTRHGISTKLYKNIRNDRFTETHSPAINVYRGDFDWADYNNDGVEDLFIIGETSNGNLVSYLYSNNRTANFMRVPTSIPGFRDGSVEWGDYDRDGDYDLLITGYTKNGPASKIYRNDRNNKFMDVNADLPGISYGVGRWADYDNDGDLDIIISGNESSGRVITKLFRNDNGIFNFVDIGFTDLKLGDIAWGDYDNDGDLDFAIIGETQSGRYESKLYSNLEEGVFSQALPNFIPVRSGSVDWGDMDHDGDLDLLLTGESKSGAVSKVYRNDRNGFFTDINANIIGLYMSDGHWGDYDNDGDLDIVISGMSNNYEFISRVYRNDAMRTETVKEGDDGVTDIWNITVVVEPKPRKIYYYVFASCYCDINGEGKKNYHAFFSPVKKQTVQYELQRKFNKIVREHFPNWVEFDQANIIENGFETIQKASESKRIAIREYESKNFEIHEIKW
ncbi:MAG: VCBS repeat-containing protein [Bacteroidetes bacterium]|nr:VCBS repeat-containing protein [Bacteroidota bacterium]MBL6944609.1 VCBS repeat-containing protein [Bacteroidales bacterium]